MIFKIYDFGRNFRFGCFLNPKRANFDSVFLNFSFRNNFQNFEKSDGKKLLITLAFQDLHLFIWTDSSLPIWKIKLIVFSKDKLRTFLWWNFSKPKFNDIYLQLCFFPKRDIPDSEIFSFKKFFFYLLNPKKKFLTRKISKRIFPKSVLNFLNEFFLLDEFLIVYDVLNLELD